MSGMRGAWLRRNRKLQDIEKYLLKRAVEIYKEGKISIGEAGIRAKVSV